MRRHGAHRGTSPGALLTASPVSPKRPLPPAAQRTLLPPAPPYPEGHRSGILKLLPKPREWLGERRQKSL